MRLSGRLGEATRAHSVATCHLCIVERVTRALHHVVRQAIIRSIGNADRYGDPILVTGARDDRRCHVLQPPFHWPGPRWAPHMSSRERALTRSLSAVPLGHIATNLGIPDPISARIFRVVKKRIGHTNRGLP